MNPPAIRVAYGIPTPEEMRERERSLASTYYLVKTAGYGDVLRCRRCKGVHRFLSWCCVERPWSSATRGLYAFWSHVGAAEVRPYLSPAQRTRVEAAGRMLGRAAGLPNLSSSHPRLAGTLRSAPGDIDTGAFTFTANPDDLAALDLSVVMGVVEPISAATARLLAARIRGRDPTFTLEGDAP